MSRLLCTESKAMIQRKRVDKKAAAPLALTVKLHFSSRITWDPLRTLWQIVGTLCLRPLQSNRELIIYLLALSWQNAVHHIDFGNTKSFLWEWMPGNDKFSKNVVVLILASWSLTPGWLKWDTNSHRGWQSDGYTEMLAGSHAGGHGVARKEATRRNAHTQSSILTHITLA